MKTFENNPATQLSEDTLFGFDFERNEFPGKAGMEAMDSVSTFSEYVCTHAVRCGYVGSPDDVGALASFVFEKCKATNATISRQTLVNWLAKGLPANTAGGRENIYRLCFALEMDAQQTREFFLKAYLERPFNYKNIQEATYLFCLNNGLSYSDSRGLKMQIAFGERGVLHEPI